MSGLKRGRRPQFKRGGGGHIANGYIIYNANVTYEWCSGVLYKLHYALYQTPPQPT